MGSWVCVLQIWALSHHLMISQTNHSRKASLHASEKGLLFLTYIRTLVKVCQSVLSVQQLFCCHSIHKLVEKRYNTCQWTSDLFVRGSSRLLGWAVVELEVIDPSLFAETTIFTPRSNQPRASLLTSTGLCFHNIVVWWVSHSEVTLHCPLCPQMCVQYQHVKDLLLKNPSRSPPSFSFVFTLSTTYLTWTTLVFNFWCTWTYCKVSLAPPGTYSVRSGIRLSLAQSVFNRIWALFV